MAVPRIICESKKGEKKRKMENYAWQCGKNLREIEILFTDTRSQKFNSIRFRGSEWRVFTRDGHFNFLI